MCFLFLCPISRPFGLVHVDYETGSLNRSLKDSSKFWIQLAETRVVPYVENPDDATTIDPPTTNIPATTPGNSATSTTVTNLLWGLFVWLLMNRA